MFIHGFVVLVAETPNFTNIYLFVTILCVCVCWGGGGGGLWGLQFKSSICIKRTHWGPDQMATIFDIFFIANV